MEKLVIAESLLREIKSVARTSKTKEICGLGFSKDKKVFGKDLMVDTLHHAKNVSTCEEAEYQFSPEDFGLFLKYHKKSGLDKKMIMVFHSHPNWSANPSVYDLNKAYQDYYYLIYSGRDDVFKCFFLESISPRLMKEIPIVVV